MSWLSSILGILKSFFSFLDKKTLTEEERVAKEKRGRKQRVKDDWKETQNEIDRAFERAKSRNRVRKSKDERKLKPYRPSGYRPKDDESSPD